MFFSDKCYDTFLSTECASPDYGVDYDNTYPNVNKGFEYRKLLFQKTPSGKAPVVHILGMYQNQPLCNKILKFQFTKLITGCLSHSLSTLSSPLIQNIAVTIKLRRNSDRRLLHTGKQNPTDDAWSLGDKEYKLSVEHLNLLVRTITNNLIFVSLFLKKIL